MNCSCGVIKVGGHPTTARNWSPTCPIHGLESSRYTSSEQVAKRERDSRRLRELQRRARAARAASA